MSSSETSMTCDTPHQLVDNSDEEDSFSLEELSDSSSEYVKIDFDLKNAGLKIKKVERLHNAHLKKRYITERDLMLQQRMNSDPDFKLNEKYLYHGTGAQKSYICEEGLDSRVSKLGCFGRGIYFSDYPGKCLKYAERNESTKSIILLSRVILGDAKVYDDGVKDKKLQREPEKSSPYTGNRFYDSVEGRPVNHKEFVVYENRRALVEYIITYLKPPTEGDAKAESVKSFAAAQDDTESSSDEDEEGYKSSGMNPADRDSSSDEDEEENKRTKTNPAKSDDSDSYKSLSSRDDDSDADPGADFEDVVLLEEFERKFSERTGVSDKHLIHVYLLMSNQDMDKAVEIFEAEQGGGAGGQDEYMTKIADEIAESKARASQVMTPARWKTMSAADKEATTQCLINDFLSVVGREEEDEDGRIMARRYLEHVDMNLDLALVSYFEELSNDV